MFNLENFIYDKVVCRKGSMFAADIEANAPRLAAGIAGSKVCVIGGAGSIGSSFIKALLPFRPASLVVVDINENGLVELTRDLRSSDGLFIPDDFRTYTLNFADPIFASILREMGGFDIVANFSAHKHVRSERDRYSVRALIENNNLKAKALMDLLLEFPPRHFFCVSTDKAANPVNIMGASKRLMEDMIMAYADCFKVTTARFANVAFSNGSLPDSWIHRLDRRQPLAAPADVLRYFVTPQESGQICLMACILGRSGEIFFPKLLPEQMRRFSEICTDFLLSRGLTPHICASDSEARRFAAAMAPDSREYPVVFTVSDTAGEKAFEEFFVNGETIDNARFRSLGVITESPRRDMADVNDFYALLADIFADPSFTKEQVVDALQAFIPTFHHIANSGASLDKKM